MNRSTLEILVCPKRKCGGSLKNLGSDFESGELQCVRCRQQYPILLGIPILFEDPIQYLLEHAKGISRWVEPQQIPPRARKEFKRALAQQLADQRQEHIEEDLESERVTSLYWMNHYLRVNQVKSLVDAPALKKWISEYWDFGPLDWTVNRLAKLPKLESVVELGCGLGGLFARLGHNKNKLRYVGVDSSFASLAWAKHMHSEVSIDRKQFKVPRDLLLGPLTQNMSPDASLISKSQPQQADWIAASIETVPLRPGSFQAAVMLNAIDMLEAPQEVPESLGGLIEPKGWVVHGAPYVWHERIVKKIRKQKHYLAEKKLTVSDSAELIESWFEQEGFRLLESEQHLPWLFLKHARQIEMYSTHLVMAQK